MRWKRTQMSVCTASMMWPMCSAPFAYGSALVTRILRLMKTCGPERARKYRVSADILHWLELGLVDALLVGLFARDHSVFQQLLDGVVHRAHPVLAARLHGGLELVELALADQVRDRRRVHQDLEGRHAAALVGALQQLLGHHAAQAGREHGA